MYFCLLLAGGLTFANALGSSIAPYETSAPIESFPYRVAIELHLWYMHEWIITQICGGSIISEHWVVTVASCNIVVLSSHRVRSGSSGYLRCGVLHRVAEFVQHEDYRFETRPRWSKTNDIGLVRVAEPFVYDATRQPIALFETGQKVPPDELACQTGWPKRNDLVVAEVPMVDTRGCNETYRGVEGIGGIAGDNICSGARDKNGEEACSVIIGDALVVKDRLVGLVSWSKSCDNGSFPVVDTSVAYHRQWIDRNSQN